MSTRFLALTTLAVLSAAGSALAQTPLRSSLIGDDIRIVNSDMAVLSAQERRDDLPCRLQPSTPRLGFDLQFNAGYVASIPLRSLAGEGNSLRVLFRITPLDGKESHFYFVDRYSVPPIEEEAKGEAVLPGRYKLGAGTYRVDWLMRDRAERVCSASWEIKTSSPDEIEELAAPRAPFTVGPRESDLFLEEPPVQRAAVRSLLHVRLLVNFTPTDPADVQLRPYDLQNIVSILRAVSREPQIGTFSLVAFNMQEERVIFEQENVSRIDFPALGEAVESIKGGRVAFAQLQDEESSSRFLGELMSRNLGPQDPPPDAVIIVGPKLMIEKKVPTNLSPGSNDSGAPVFYLIYNTDPQVHPWRDAISSVLKVFKGLEYTISLPKDLGKAMNDMMLRLTQRQEIPQAALAGGDSGSQ